MDSLVSVVMPTYNREFDSIKKSVESVLRQTYENIELIIVDDNGLGSNIQKNNQISIESLKINYKITYIANKKNSGAQFSRNQGILASRGEFIAFLDDDDLWEEDKIEKQMSLFIDDSVGLVYSKGWILDYNMGGYTKKPYYNSYYFLDCVDFDDLSCSDYIGTTSQAIIKKEVFSVCGLFDYNQPARQDYEMWIRISQKYKCIGVPEPLFYHIIHSGEQISKSSIKGAIGMKNIYLKYKKQMGFTAKNKTLYRTSRSYYSARKLFKCAYYFVCSIIFFLLSFLFDHKRYQKVRIKSKLDKIKKY